MQIGYLMTDFFREQDSIYNELLSFSDNYFKNTIKTDKIETTLQSTARFYSKFLFELKNILDDKIYVSFPFANNINDDDIKINLINQFDSNNSFIKFDARAPDIVKLFITNEFKLVEIVFTSPHGDNFNTLMRNFILDDFLEVVTTNWLDINKALKKNKSIYNIIKDMKNINQELSFTVTKGINLFHDRIYVTTKEIFDICKPLADIVSLTHDVNIHNDLIVLKAYITNKQNQKITYE